MIARITRFVERHPVSVIVTWAVAALAMYGVATFGIGDTGGISERTSLQAPEVEGSESYLVLDTFTDTTPERQGDTVSADFRVSDPADPAIAAALQPGLAALASISDVAAVATPFASLPGPAYGRTEFPGGLDPSSLVRTDGGGFMVVAVVAPDAPSSVHRQIIDLYEDMADELRTVDPEALVFPFSMNLLHDSVTDMLERDLLVGEAIALPLALFVMMLVFGGVLASSTPMAGAFASIAGGFVVVYALTFPLDVSNSAQNVVTVLGIGLCIDYGLLIVSRYREEMTKARSLGLPRVPEDSLVKAMETAGRTVFFSAVTVGIAVSGMLAFAPEILRSFGVAALGVVVTALAAALTLVPAVAYLYGERLIRPGLLSRLPLIRSVFRFTSDVTRDEGAFSRLTAWVQKRPWTIVGASAAILLALAVPALSIHMRNSDVELLPPDNPDRAYLADLPLAYPSLADPAIVMMTDTPPSEFAQVAAQIAEIPHVIGVAPYRDQGGIVFWGVYLDDPDAGSAVAVDVVTQIRALDTPDALHVGGKAANQIDFVDAIQEGAPIALSIVVLSTLVLLFLMTGSLLVPIKALLVNALSLTASIGVLVWLFQWGNLEGPLGFASPDGVETYVVILVLAFGFGLAMDYEVFLLSRIKELVDRGVPNDEAVRLGLQRSARIITSAAAIVILVFLGFAAGHMLVIKEVGVGLAFAVFMDATLVRMFLVPATMTLLGDWNWWAPGPLRRLHNRRGLSHDSSVALRGD
ncbi:MAG: MMPL family transporter [Demequinaceae bacterium]|nr:MMPL family transporter [Demequinaceae bacterium]